MIVEQISAMTRNISTNGFDFHIFFLFLLILVGLQTQLRRSGAKQRQAQYVTLSPCHTQLSSSVGKSDRLYLQVLQKLLEKLTGERLAVPEVTQSEEGQKNKLK